MRYKKIPSFGEKERALVSELVEVGLEISAARVLVFLISTGRAATSLDIEHGTGMSQPQVSRGLAVLDKIYHYLDSAEVHSDPYEPRGRKARSYYLKCPPEAIIDDIFLRLETRKEVILGLVKHVSKERVQGGEE